MVISIDPVKKAAIDKANAIKAVDKWFSEQVAAGFETEDGWRLGMSTEDVTLLTGNYVLAKEAAALGADLPPVVDMDGHAHTFTTIAGLTDLMLAYGQARAALSAEYASKKAAITG